MFNFCHDIELSMADIVPPEMQPKRRIVVGSPAERYVNARAGRHLTAKEVDELINMQ